jgi:hypothetical protein
MEERIEDVGSIVGGSKAIHVLEIDAEKLGLPCVLGSVGLVLRWSDCFAKVGAIQ